jgi:hypothetical protein
VLPEVRQPQKMTFRQSPERVVQLTLLLGVLYNGGTSQYLTSFSRHFVKSACIVMAVNFLRTVKLRVSLRLKYFVFYVDLTVSQGLRLNGEVRLIT